MIIKPITINAVDIPDAWFQCVRAIQEDGHRYINQLGSYENQVRIEFEYITVSIDYPYKEPYNLMLPHIPAHLGITDPVTPGYIEQYIPYLMTDHIELNEQYTYGSRIQDQISYWIKILKATPNTNQAVLQVAQPSDYKLSDSPCLRHIDMKVSKGALNFFPYFRSWELWGGFPANLAGIAIMQKYMADEIGITCGSICASSKGLHLYSYVEELAKLRCYFDN